MKKVLVAEDSSVIQNLTKKILQFQNYDIKGVKNGKEVLKTIETENFDIILMDINMPQMDGMECIKELRAHTNQAIATIPVVAITGNAKNYTEDEFKKAGFNDYLTKPLDFDKLVQTVKKFTQ